MVRAAARLKSRDPLPEILSGNPEHTRMLIDSSPHKWSYRAGVISFDADDKPTEAEQSEVMETFEAVAFAGLEPEQVNMLWVRHSDQGRVELHFCTPRLELTSRKSFNIAPPGYQKAFDAVRDLLNKQHDWADPEEPSRALERKTEKEARPRAQSREAVQNWIEDLIISGEINNRAEMVTSLQQAGFEIPRQAKQTITILDPDSNTRWRMKGTIFHDNWTRDAALERQAQRPHAEHATAANRLDGISLQELRERYQNHIERRARYNRSRYPLPARDLAPELERDIEQGMGDGRESTADPTEADEAAMAHDRPHPPALGAPDLGRPLDLDTLFSRQPAQQSGQQLGQHQSEPPLCADRHQDGIGDALPDDREPIPLLTLLTRPLPHDADNPTNLDDTTRTRIARLRGRLDRQIGALHRGTEQLAATLNSLADQTVRSTRGLTHGLHQLTTSLQRSFDWLGRSANQQSPKTSLGPSAEGPQRDRTNRFIASVLKARTKSHQLER